MELIPYQTKLLFKMKLRFLIEPFVEDLVQSSLAFSLGFNHRKLTLSVD